MEKIVSMQLPLMCGGEKSPLYNPDVDLGKVVINSKEVTKNCLFVAIKGEKNDGHDYVNQVVADPTNFALVNKDFALDIPNLIRVEDTSLALGQLAANYRHQFSIPLVAITGSNGKTTVKEMLKNVCIAQYGDDQVLATSGNYNNHLGMPLTILQLSSEHKVAIIEMGMNHAKELEYLSGIAKPTLAVINNVMFAHAGFFKSLGDIASAKEEIFHGLSPKGMACIDVGSQFANRFKTNLQLRKIPIFEYGSQEAGCYLKKLDATGATYVTPLGELKVLLQVLGEHNYQNALTVIALAVNLGCQLNAIKFGLESYLGYQRRLERKVAFNGALVIDDSYNANPGSVRAALKAIAQLPKPHWFIFADLKELGQFETEFHQQLGQEMNGYQLDKLLTVGELALLAANSFDGDKIHFTNNQDIVQYCLENLPKQATVLVKGSLSMNLAEVIKGITKQG